MLASVLSLFLLHDAHAGAVASSFKKETKLGANYWSGQAAIDGKTETCWMLPGESANLGESITIDLPKGEVDKIAMVIGWSKDGETFQDYARVQAARVEVFSYNDDRELISVGASDVQFADKSGLQIVDIPDLKVGTEDAGGKIKISVSAVYPGRDYPNLAVSEVFVVMKEFDALLKVEDVSGADAGHGQEQLTDANPKTFWAAPAMGAQIAVVSPGFGLSHIGLTQGPKDYARVKKLRVSVGGRVVEVDVPDAAGPQWIEVPAISGYTGSTWGTITLEVLETWPGAKSQSVAIGELSAKATNFEAL